MPEPIFQLASTGSGSVSPDAVGLVERGDDGLGGELLEGHDQARQEPDPELPPEDGGDPKDRPCVTGQPLDAGEEESVQGFRDGVVIVGRGGQRAHHLLHEEGIAARARTDQPHVVRGQATDRHQVLDELRGLRLRQGGQDDLGG